MQDIIKSVIKKGDRLSDHFQKSGLIDEHGLDLQKMCQVHKLAPVGQVVWACDLHKSWVFSSLLISQKMWYQKGWSLGEDCCVVLHIDSGVILSKSMCNIVLLSVCVDNKRITQLLN